MIRWLFPGLFRERTRLGVPIDVNDSGTTSVDISKVRRFLALEELIGQSGALELYDSPVPWTNCAVRNPTIRGSYLCFEPDIGPGPDFVFLRWDGDRGWRDDNDNKGFPTHWVLLNIPADRS